MFGHNDLQSATGLVCFPRLCWRGGEDDLDLKDEGDSGVRLAPARLCTGMYLPAELDVDEGELERVASTETARGMAIGLDIASKMVLERAE